MGMFFFFSRSDENVLKLILAMLHSSVNIFSCIFYFFFTYLFLSLNFCLVVHSILFYFFNF